MGELINKLKDLFSSILGGLILLGIILFFLIIWSAGIYSYFFSATDKTQLSHDLKIIEASQSNLKHNKIIKRFMEIAHQVGYSEDVLEIYFIDEPSSLNAVSFGDGIFIFWESIADLPDWVQDSILSHEIAHDLLLHSRKMQELDDVRDFFTEVLSLFGGADSETEKTLQNWSSKLVIPQYSQQQELEADCDALLILSLYGYEKADETFSNALNYIRDNYGDRGGGFFDSHPSTDERLENISPNMEKQVRKRGQATF